MAIEWNDAVGKLLEQVLCVFCARYSVFHCLMFILYSWLNLSQLVLSKHIIRLLFLGSLFLGIYLSFESMLCSRQHQLNNKIAIDFLIILYLWFYDALYILKPKIGEHFQPVSKMEKGRKR